MVMAQILYFTAKLLLEEVLVVNILELHQLVVAAAAAAVTVFKPVQQEPVVKVTLVEQVQKILTMMLVVVAVEPGVLGAMQLQQPTVVTVGQEQQFT